MPWPERDFVTRLLGGVVGATLGGVLLTIILTRRYFTLRSATSLPFIGAAIGAGVGFIAGFVGGDSAVRFLARLLGGGRGAA